MSRISYLGSLAGALVGVGLAACSIPDTAFHATPDAGGAIDVPTAVLSIVPSAAVIAVDEGARKDFTVVLSQPPSAPLTVSVATAAMTKLGLSVQALSFTRSNFDQPQTVTLTGLTDRDTVDERTDITLSAPGVDPVTVSATVHDLDKVSLIVNGGAGNALQIDEGATATVQVHLSAQPTGDVSVSAILGSGPVTVSPSMRVFTQANYDVDQTFTLTAMPDSNTVSEDQSLTLRATGVPDKLVSIHDVDKDVQNIKVSASATTITEGSGSATLDVSLTQQPSTSVTVTITTTTHQARVNAGQMTQLTFTPQNYATSQSVQVDAPADPDTVDGSDTIGLKATDPDSGTMLDRTVAMTIHDPDVQHILEDAPSPLPITELTKGMFNVTLQFKPTQNTMVNVTSLDTGAMTVSPGALMFTPADYNLPHTVTVTGVHDNNLTADTRSVRLVEPTIGTVDVPVQVADVDRQVIVLSASSLSVPEGTSRTFDVSLMFDPGASVTVTLTNDNQAALPISLTSGGPPQNGVLSIPFTSASYATPVHVTVSPPVDSNNASETATVTASGAGAPASPAITLTTTDTTVIQPWGWPTPFTTTTQVSGGFAIAYKVNVGAVANLEAFHVHVPTGIGLFRMALYTDVSGKPGHLVAQMGDGKVMIDRTNDGPPLANTQLTDPAYWLVVRFSTSVNIGYDLPGTSVNRCISNSKYATVSDPWVTDFTDVTCGNDHLFNIWITTYHQ